MALNLTMLEGRLTKDPELRQTTTGKNVTTFTVAVNRYGGTGEQAADFIDCVAWNTTAEFVSNHFHKGKPILCVGKLQVRTYTDKDGKNRKVMEVVVNQASFVEGDKKQSLDVDADGYRDIGFGELDGDGLPF